MNVLRVVERGGLTFRVEESPATAWGFWDFWTSGQWEPPTVAAAERLLKRGDTLLDVGAWVGPLTLWAAARGVRVIAMEPDLVAFAQLQQNVTASGFADLVECINKAVAIEEEIELYTGVSRGLGYSSTVPREDLPERMTVHGVSLRTLVEKYGPSLVKMDIEGGEAAVLARDGYALRERGIPLLLATHQFTYSLEADAALRAELGHWTLVEDLKNEMWLYVPRKS